MPDVEAERARVSALLGVCRGKLEQLQREIDETAQRVTGYSVHPSGTISLHFSKATILTDSFAGAMALQEAEQVVASSRHLQLVAPESSR